MNSTRCISRAIAAATTSTLVLLAHAGNIVVGQVAPFSGLDASSGRAYATGMQLLFDNVNSTGGVHGNTFTLIRKDDGGRADDTLTLTEQLVVKEKPLVLAGYFGNKNVSNLVASGLLEREKITLLGYRTSEIRPEVRYLYNVRASLSSEISKFTAHLATIGITRLGLLYEDGAGAAALLEVADEEAKKAGVTLTIKASYPSGTTQLSRAIEAFVKSPPQAIIMVASGAVAAAFIEQYRSGGGAAQLFAHSGADIEQLSKRLAEEQMQGVAIAQVTPSPYRISSRLAKELSDTLAKSDIRDIQPSYAMMEGYITAKVIVEAVRRQGARPSREGMVPALDSIEGLDVGGYVVGFKPGLHTGSRFVELSIISSTGRIRQ